MRLGRVFDQTDQTDRTDRTDRTDQLISTTLGLLIALLVLAVAPAAAQSAAELRGKAAALAAQLPSAGSAEAQRQLIEQLGELATTFIQLADKATLSGEPGAQGGELRAAYEAVSAPLEAIQDRAREATDGQVEKIIAADGDLEALYETPQYKQAQQTGAQALYFLNWLRYYGARLYDGERRKKLLEQAQAGFSDFTGGEENELTVESVLGRGLCQLELGKLDAAVHDLEAVAGSAKASPERREKARLALLDAYVRRGSNDRALSLSEEILKTASGTEADYVRFVRVRVLLDAAKKSKGAAGDRYRTEAMQLMDRLRRNGGAWEARVTALMQSELDNPEEWSKKANSPFAKWELARLLIGKNDYDGATPLLAEVVASDDPSLKGSQAEASYFLGLAYFKAGKYALASQQLERALRDQKLSYAADAAYLRFKAVEAMVAADPQSVAPADYEAALREYLQRFPEHKSAFEAHYRLGELYQAQSKFRDAIAEYAQVKGDPAFEIQARFATVQSQFELLSGADSGTRTQLLAQIDAGLQRFTSDSAALDKKLAPQLPLAQMKAKAGLMRAVYVKLQPQHDPRAVIAALAVFDAGSPEQAELLPQVVKLRLEAYREIGDFDAARKQLQQHGKLVAQAMDASAIEELAVGYIRAGARDKTKNDAAQQVALALYELLPAEGGTASRHQLTLARLYENTGKRAQAAAIYRELAGEKASASSALRGLARIAEDEHRLDEAAGHWRKLGEQARPGDLPWYESTYNVARVISLQGNKTDSCKLLTDLRPAMPGLSDQDLRQKLSDLYAQVCS